MKKNNISIHRIHTYLIRKSTSKYYTKFSEYDENFTSIQTRKSIATSQNPRFLKEVILDTYQTHFHFLYIIPFCFRR